MERTESNGPRDPLRPFAQVVQPLWRSALLVLIALGGAGLAVGVDRPQTSAQRPELSWRADQQAAPWITRLSAALAPLDADVSALSGHAQGLLGNIIGLQLDEANTALAAGDEAATRVASSGAQLASDRDAALAELATWRLGDIAQNSMERLNAATDAVQ